jgi:hypothetical protein
VLTTIASETVVNNKTQLIALIAAFNAVNAFLSTDSSGMTATLPDDIEWIEPDTPIRDKMERLLSQGDISNNVLSWGVYEERRFCVEVSAAATPETVHYYEHSRTGIITDPYGNVVDPWLVRPNRMAQVIDVLDVAPPPGAVDGATRKHVARVTCRISSSGVTVSLDPTEDASIDKILASPNGVATSDRQAAVDRALASSMRSRFESTENPSTYDDGVWQPGAGGTGMANGGIIDTGGGDITNTGGGDIDLGTGGGIGGTGSTGTTTTGGTPGALAKWDTPSKLKDAVADVDYVAPGSLGETIDDRVAALLVAGTGIGLSYNDPGNALTISATLTLSSLGAAPSDATYIVQTASSGLSAEQALGSLATGLVKNTTTTGVLSIAVAGTDYLAPGDAAPVDAKYIVQTANGTLTNEQVLGSLATGLVKNTTTTGVLSIAVAGTDYVAPGALNEAIDDRVAALLVEGANISLTYNDAANTLTIAAAGSVGGTGTAGRLAQWNTGGADITNSTLIKSGAGVLTLASGSNTMTLTIGASGGTLNLAGNTLALANNLTTSGAGDITLSAAGAYTLTIPATGTAALGTGAADKLAVWTGTNAIASETNLHWDGSNNRLGINDSTPAYTLDVTGDAHFSGQIFTSDNIKTGAGNLWDLGSYAAGGTLTAQGRVSISINGTTYYLLARTS